MARTSARASITDAEYWRLIGLKVAHEKQYAVLKAMEDAANSITQELDHDGKPETDMGLTIDYLYGSRTLDELLRILELKRETPTTSTQAISG